MGVYWILSHSRPGRESPYTSLKRAVAVAIQIVDWFALPKLELLAGQHRKFASSRKQMGLKQLVISNGHYTQPTNAEWPFAWKNP